MPEDSGGEDLLPGSAAFFRLLFFEQQPPLPPPSQSPHLDREQQPPLSPLPTLPSGRHLSLHASPPSPRAPSSLSSFHPAIRYASALLHLLQAPSAGEDLLDIQQLPSARETTHRPSTPPPHSPSQLPFFPLLQSPPPPHLLLLPSLRSIRSSERSRSMALGLGGTTLIRGAVVRATVASLREALLVAADLAGGVICRRSIPTRDARLGFLVM